MNNKIGMKELVSKALKTKPEYVVVGELGGDELERILDATSGGYLMDTETMEKINNDVCEEMLERAFESKDKEMILLIENKKKLDREISKYKR